MRFEQFDQDFEAQEALLPDGENEVEIVRVKEWQSKTDSRKALILTLRPVGKECSDVEKWLDPSRKDDHRAAMQLADSLGIPRDDDLTSRNLEGRRVIAKTRTGENKKGQRLVYVNQFLAATDAPATPPAAKSARTAKQKVDAAGQGGNTDDIPF